MRKEGGKPTAPRDRESSSRPGRQSPGSFQTRPGKEVLEVCGARYSAASWEGERK